jgi:hypothetical protein
MTTQQFLIRKAGKQEKYLAVVHSRLVAVSVAPLRGEADVFSAKGARFMSKPGAAAQVYGDPKPAARKARFTFCDENALYRLNRAFCAFTWWNRSPGALPQAEPDVAPLALNISFQ